MTQEIVTSRFGTIEVPEERIFLFPRGLIGFERLKRYARLDSAKGGTVQWLQAMDDPEVAFLIAEPSTYLPNFRIRLAEADVSRAERNGVNLDRLETLTILHVDREEGTLHIHVQAPLLVDPVSRRGVQVITDADRPTVALPLKPA